MSMRLGYKPSPSGIEGSHSFGRLMGADPINARTSASLRQYVPTILDQQLQDCIACSGAQAVRIGMLRDGVADPPLLSLRFAYYNLRAAAGDQYLDCGGFVHHFWDVVASLGFCPEYACEYAPELYAEQPQWKAYRSAADQRTRIGYARITSTGGQLVDDVKAAIDAGFPVQFGTAIDDVFSRWIPGDKPWPGPIGTVLGGHAMLAAEYDADSIGVVNSWGQAWGDRGWLKMNFDALESWRDVWIAKRLPVYSGTK